MSRWALAVSRKTLRASIPIFATLALSSQLVLAQPTVTGIAPNRGTTQGGIPVTITGNNLQPPAGSVVVTIGGNPATNVYVTGPGMIEADTPPGIAGAADVVVKTLQGTGTGVGLYTYELPPYPQQGPKLVGNDAVGWAQQGYSVALSGDGNTTTVGGPGDNQGVGAVWVYTRSGGIWTQQGSKLVGTTPLGHSVALSADGNTAIFGVPGDNSGVGGLWVFTRSGGVWSQQSKLVGSGYIGSPGQGFSVALSADGNTAIVGGQSDNGGGGSGVGLCAQ
jgi:hypothetical protein